MVLDTRWKRFKYSNASKTLCVLMALVMASVFVINSFSLILGFAFFNEEALINKKDRSFYSSYLFTHSLNRDISAVVKEVNYNAELKQYYEAETEYVEKAMKLYKEEEAKNRLTVQEVLEYIEALGGYGASVSDFDDYYDGELRAYYNIYKGDDGNFYQNDFGFSSLTTEEYGSDNLNFGHTDEEARNLLKDYFKDHNYYDYVSDLYYNSNFYSLENINIYAENNDGTVFTNVEDGEAFVNGIQNGKEDYIVFEDGEVRLSESLEELRENLWGQDTSGGRIYITLNTAFTGDDRYGVMFSEYNRIADIDIVRTATVIVISLIAMIVLMVMSVRLAGHTEEGISIALIDKFPLDLHFVIMGGLVFLSGLGIAVLLMYYGNYLEYGYYGFAVSFFLTSKLFISTLIALVFIIYLLILEFATSVARNVKAERPIIKRTAIFKIFALIFKLIKLICKLTFKLIKLIFKHGGKGTVAVLKFIFVTVIGGFFKMIGKLFRIFLHMCKSIALKPKRLEKKLVRATVLYTLFNIVLIGFTVFDFVVYLANDEGFFFFVAFLAFVVLIALDAYAVYRAMKYLKALDDIIDSSAKREPLPYETDALPPSLKTLAESLEATNAELQEAVLKAVKDERTKAELITNVSHDLKTPLTSVINYIDLLQKCDIEDETAKQYMAVIDEKSARLKRLIEDLIEASKVSTGNVTLNKTKLNLCELASQAIVEETSDIEKNNLQIIFEEASNKHIVYADGTKIYRVFENLLSNARKYSAPYTRIYARVYSDDNAGYFEIKNISKDPLNISAEELTERFVRGDKSRSEEGNGLGLSIARELCKLNGGDLIITIDGDLFKATVKLPKEENQENKKE